MAAKQNGATVKDVDPQEFVVALAAHLKKKLELPEWHDLVKTAAFKEMPPQDADWYYVRAGKSPCGASLLALLVTNRNLLKRPGHSASFGAFHSIQQQSIAPPSERSIEQGLRAADARLDSFERVRMLIRGIFLLLLLCCAAAIARRVYLRGGSGVGAFAKVFGGRRRHGIVSRNHFAESAKGVNRHILKALQSIDILAQKEHRKYVAMSSPLPSPERLLFRWDACFRGSVCNYSPLRSFRCAARSNRGRFITSNGQRELDTIANQIAIKRKQLLQNLQ